MLGRKRNDVGRSPSAGEVVFDRAVYTGLGFVANEALAMLMAVEMRHFVGKEQFLKASKWMEKNMGYKAKTVNGVTTSGLERAADALEIGTLLASGTMMIVPMKMMEDREDKIVRRINHAFDKLSGSNKTKEEVAARDAEVEQAIACQPKQTWGSLLAGRGIATVTNMFALKETVFAGDRTQKVRDWSKKYVGMVADKVHPAGAGKPRSERFNRYAEIFGLETLYTGASAFVTEAASKFIAGKKPAVKDPQRCAVPFPVGKGLEQVPQKPKKGFVAQLQGGKVDSHVEKVQQSSQDGVQPSL